MKFRVRVYKELFGSATRCAFPRCREKLVVVDRGLTMINVDIAHIRSAKAGGPRHEVGYPVEWLDDARNLLLLCTKHHRLVDLSVNPVSAYTVTELEHWKREQVAGGIGGALPPGLTEESFLRFHESFAEPVAEDPEFERWRPGVGGGNAVPTYGGGAGFAFVADDPVSVSAAWSVAQLVHGFAPGAVVFPESAATFGATVAAFLLDDETGFTKQVEQLVHCCGEDPFEVMLTSFAFAVTAVQLWERATGQLTDLLRDSWVVSGLTIPYLADIVMAARYGRNDHDPLPGHPVDQQKVTMNLGKVTAMTLQLTADHSPNPLVSVVQDLLVGVQRVPGSSR